MGIPGEAQKGLLGETLRVLPEGLLPGVLSEEAPGYAL